MRVLILAIYFFTVLNSCAQNATNNSIRNKLYEDAWRMAMHIQNDTLAPGKTKLPSDYRRFLIPEKLIDSSQSILTSIVLNLDTTKREELRLKQQMLWEEYTDIRSFTVSCFATDSVKWNQTMPGQIPLTGNKCIDSLLKHLPIHLVSGSVSTYDKSSWYCSFRFTCDSALNLQLLGSWLYNAYWYSGWYKNKKNRNKPTPRFTVTANENWPSGGTYYARPEMLNQNYCIAVYIVTPEGYEGLTCTQRSTVGVVFLVCNSAATYNRIFFMPPGKTPFETQ
jgi:hypothetical protein